MKEQRQKQREQKKQQLDKAETKFDTEVPQQENWGTVLEETFQRVGRQGRRRRRKRKSDDDDNYSEREPRVSRCFSVLSEQRQVLQGCRAQL